MTPEKTQTNNIGASTGNSNAPDPWIEDERAMTSRKVQDVFSDLFADEKIQNQIQRHLKDVLQDELSKMSILMRKAIREWIQKEKQRFNQGGDNQTLQLEEKLESVQQQNTALEEENKKLKRQLELKAHENAIVMTGMERVFSRSPEK